MELKVELKIMLDALDSCDDMEEEYEKYGRAWCAERNIVIV